MGLTIYLKFLVHQQHFWKMYCNMHTSKNIPVFPTGIKTISLRLLPLSYRRLVGCGHIFVFKNAETNILLKVKFHFTFCINKGIKKMWFTDLCHSWPPMQLHCQKKDFHVLPVLRTHKIFFFSEFACDQCWRNHIFHSFTILETYHLILNTAQFVIDRMAVGQAALAQQVVHF